eukprot:4158-Ditylum_brightwellii.AAC.1
MAISVDETWPMSLYVTEADIDTIGALDNCNNTDDDDGISSATSGGAAATTSTISGNGCEQCNADEILQAFLDTVGKHKGQHRCCDPKHGEGNPELPGTIRNGPI